MSSCVADTPVWFEETPVWSEYGDAKSSPSDGGHYSWSPWATLSGLAPYAGNCPLMVLILIGGCDGPITLGCVTTRNFPVGLWYCDDAERPFGLCCTGRLALPFYGLP